MSTTAEASIAPLSRKRLIQITALAWFAVIGLDFFLDAGLLARFYRWDLPGFLPPLKMFQFIPFGYAAFLLWTILLVWLMTRLSITGFRAGAIFGLKVGVLLAAAGFFGQLSVFAFPARMLLLWLVAKLAQSPVRLWRPSACARSRVAWWRSSFSVSSAASSCRTSAPTRPQRSFPAASASIGTRIDRGESPHVLR
jgi:hypothetical protein